MRRRRSAAVRVRPSVCMQCGAHSRTAAARAAVSRQRIGTGERGGRNRESLHAGGLPRLEGLRLGGGSGWELVLGKPRPERSSWENLVFRGRPSCGALRGKNSFFGDLVLSNVPFRGARLGEVPCVRPRLFRGGDCSRGARIGGFVAVRRAWRADSVSRDGPGRSLSDRIGRRTSALPPPAPAMRRDPRSAAVPCGVRRLPVRRGGGNGGIRIRRLHEP